MSTRKRGEKKCRHMKTNVGLTGAYLLEGKRDRRGEGRRRKGERGDMRKARERESDGE